MLTCDAYIAPRSLDEAFAAMRVNRGRYRIIAGATVHRRRRARAAQATSAFRY